MGFSIRRFVRWFDVRHGKGKRRKDFLKLHFVVNVKNLLTSRSRSHLHSSLTQNRFSTFQLQQKPRKALCGEGMPLTEDMQHHGQARRHALHLSQEEHREDQEPGLEGLKGNARDVLNEQEALQEEVYHRRNLTETAISTVKRRFSCTLYSKKRRGQKNELRLKVITYNLSIIARLPVQFG